jgi:GST-like protein
MEVKRQLDVLDRRLAEHRYVAGEDYTIADIATWPWYGALAQGRIYNDAATFLALGEYRNLQRWTAEVAGRPAVVRGRIVNRLSGVPNEVLAERHSAADIDRVLGRAG